jgi:hypothetical protein
MASIPNGNFNFESEALKLYESDESDRLFATARDRFPSYQTSQLFDAIDWILDGLADNFASKYSESDWEVISGQLSDHIHNGLT